MVLLPRLPNIEKNLRDFLGRTPMSYAAGSGSISVLRLLLDHQEIDPKISDNERTFLHWTRLDSIIMTRALMSSALTALGFHDERHQKLAATEGLQLKSL